MSLQLVNVNQLQKPDIQNSFRLDSCSRGERPIHLIQLPEDQPHKDASMIAECTPAIQNCIKNTA
jgi:hypothetical protein